MENSSDSKFIEAQIDKAKKDGWSVASVSMSEKTGERKITLEKSPNKPQVVSYSTQANEE